jgi:hypothetical protein
MADRTDVFAAPEAHIPHTEAEKAALRALFEHAGTPFAPACAECLDSMEGCAEGIRLRRAIRDATQARAGGPTVREYFEWCHWHRAYAWGVRLIDWVDEGSGPGGRPYYACSPCRERHALVPFADRPPTGAGR